MFKQKIINEIRKEMDKRGMSQSELGQEIGMDRRNVNRTLNDCGKTASLEKLIEMASALKLKVSIKIEKVR